LAGNKIVLLKWFRFYFERDWYSVYLREQENVWNEALARLARQKKASDEEIAEKGHRRKRSGR
jgi:hypothetical protein